MANVVWSQALLDILKVPKTPENYRFVNAWATREHNRGPNNRGLVEENNNPFNTTAGGSATVGPIKSGQFPYWNSFGPDGKYHVASYPSLGVGVYANAYHISAQYRSIYAALKSGRPESFAGNAGFQQELKQWSGSGYDSLGAISAPSSPVGPTVDSSRLGSDVLKAFGSSGVGKSISGAATSVGEKLPGVKQAEKVVAGISDIGGFLAKVTDISNLLRAGQVIAGSFLVLTGVILLARQVALAADIPDPALLAGAVGKAGKVASAVASQTPARREGRAIERDARTLNSGRIPSAREGVQRQTESISADSGTTRAQDRQAQKETRESRRGPNTDIPF